MKKLILLASIFFVLSFSTVVGASPVPNAGFETGDLSNWTTYCSGASGGCNDWSVDVDQAYAYSGQYGARLYIARLGHWGGAILLSEWFTDTSENYTIPMKLVGGATAFYSGLIVNIYDSQGYVQYRGNTQGSVFCWPNQAACEYFTLTTGVWVEYMFNFQQDYQDKYGRHPDNSRRVLIDAYQDDDFVEVYVDDVFVKPVISVDIDVKPGSFPNAINLNFNGRIPVAILTTDSFDATMVDPSTVEFEGAEAEHWAIEDVDGDGDDDMILHFKRQEVDVGCGDTEASLTGQTLDGTEISGTDSVKTVPCE